MKKFSTDKSYKTGLHVERIVPFFIVCLLFVFILYPVIMVVITSFYKDSQFTFEAYRKVFTEKGTYKAIYNTVKMEVGILLGTTVLGGGLAVLNQKTDFKYKKLLNLSVFLSFCIPPYIVAVSWVEFMGRGGYLCRFLNIILPSYRYHFNAYTLEATAIILILHLYPLVYYAISNGLKMIDGNYIISARTCGASKKQILFKIMIPFILPSILSGGLLVLSRSMANFGVPAQLALPSGIEVMTTRIFSAMSDLDLMVVAVLSLILILFSAIAFIQSKKILKNKRFDFHAQGYSENTTLSLGKHRITVYILVTFFFLTAVAIPLVTIVVSSFFKRWGLPFNISNLTFGNYKKLFFEENILTLPLVNSILYGVIGAGIAGFLAGIIVYFDKYKNNIITDIIIKTAQLPIAVPNMILAIAAIFAWMNEPFRIYGTRYIILLTYSVLFLPICIRQIEGTASNLDISLDMAAKTMGIGIWTRYFKLFLPQIKSSVISGALICFLIALKEIPISLLLYTSKSKTLGVMVFTIQSNSYGLEMTSTISVVIIFLSLMGNLILENCFLKKGVKREK